MYRYFMWLPLDTTQEENWRVIVLIPVDTCEYALHSNKGFMKLWKLKRCLLAIDSQLPCCCSFVCWSGTDNSCKWEELLTNLQESLAPCTLHQTAWVQRLVPTWLFNACRSNPSYITSSLSRICLSCVFSFLSLLQHHTVLLWAMSNKNWNLQLRNQVGMHK